MFCARAANWVFRGRNGSAISGRECCQLQGYALGTLGTLRLMDGADAARHALSFYRRWIVACTAGELMESAVAIGAALGLNGMRRRPDDGSPSTGVLV